MNRLSLGILCLVWLEAGSAATIPNAPPFVASSAFANVLVDMSVETPMGGAAYADQAGNPPGCSGRSNPGGGEVGACYFPSYAYLGIFDPDKCYTYSYSVDQFNPDGVASAHVCSGKWSGNFLNWANMTAVDMFIWTMTGGDRDTDTDTETVLQRARVQNNQSWYPIKYVADASGATPWSGPLYITNHDMGGYQFEAGTTRGSNNRGTFYVKVKVCDQSQGLEANCKGYSSGGTTVYKPEGLIQRYSDKMRFGVFAYTNDNNQSRDGGVLRTPMGYVGEQEMDDDGNLIANPAKEINPDTGQIYSNPLGAPGGWSGVINYINRFHRDGYKTYDPISEMYYEVLRYLKHLDPTPEYASGGAPGGAPGGSFPIYRSWNDPFQFSCQKSFIVAINDANPWLDKRLPGTFFTCDKTGRTGMPGSFTANDCGEPSNPDNQIDVTTLTNQVGDLEGLDTTWTQNDATGTDAVAYVYNESSNVGNCNNDKSVDVSHLGQVMGTCPYAPKQNSYYIAGLAYYGNITDLRGDIDGTQNVNSFFIDTQEYSVNPLSGNHNMLYLAGKYGGFIDLNGNNEPDLQAEWDADADGQPDNYVLATTPDKLVSGLQRAFNNILEKSGSASNVTANSTQFASDSVVYQARFNSGTWAGELLAYPITNTGVSDTPQWSASEQMPGPDSRNIYTRSGGAATPSPSPFQWGDLSAGDQALLGSQDVVAYLRGDRSREVQQGGGFRDRPIHNVLGDIVHSSPFYVKDTDTVYAGANDGMLHAFDASTGTELFAYIPSALIPRLGALTRPTYTHQYYVDGDIVVSSRAETPAHNYLAATLGAAEKGLFGLDVTDPSSFAAGGAKWECFYSGGTVAACQADPNLGYMLGRPIIAKTNDGSTALIVGNGYNSTSGKAVLYVFDLATGAVIRRIDTGVAGDNGLAGPGVFDSDGDGAIDVVYAGDLKGNVWKFDLSDSDHNNWAIALSGQPLFVAQYYPPDGSPPEPQPITAPITVAIDTVESDPSNGKRFLFFGTGSYFRQSDPNDTKVQSWYGLIDESDTTHTPISGRSNLTERSIVAEGTYDDRPVRTFSAPTSGDMVGKSGWYMDLKDPSGSTEDEKKKGERMVTASSLYTLAEPVLIASSIIPVVDPCTPGGRGYVNAISPFTGARLYLPLFDINDDNSFGDDQLDGAPIGGVDLGVGMPSEPVLVGDRLVVGGSAGNVEDTRVNTGAAPIRGRVSWDQIIKD